MSLRSLAPVLGLLAVFAAVAFLVSPGFFNIDEFIYYTGAKAFADGAITVPNGAEGLASYQLRLWILVDGPNGLTPQYPVGSAIAGGVLLTLFGLHGLILLNALAAAGVVWLTYRFAARFLGGHRVGLGAAALLVASTFFLEFAFAVWPHAISMLAVLLALHWLLQALEEDGDARGKMLAMGAVLGLGMAFRTDVAIAIAATGICIFLWSGRPIARLFWFGLGLVPPIALLALANWYKFGDFNPLSYGQTHGGGTNLATHLILLLVLAAGALAALGLRWAWSRTHYRRYLVVTGGIGVVIGLVLARDFAWAYLHGFWALIVDATAIDDTRAGVVRMADGTLSFWGHWKKALGQSMPWLALSLAALFGLRGAGTHTLRVFAVFAVVWSLPFFLRDWHGGMGSNMRYFLPLVPLACGLCANLIARMWEATPAAPRVLSLSVFAGTMLTIMWAVLHHSGAAGAQQIMPTYLFLATAALALVAGYLQFGNRPLNLCLMVLVGTGIGVGFQLAITDFRTAQDGRALAHRLSTAHAQLPDRSLAFVPSRFLVGWALEKGHVAALPSDRDGRFDTGLIDAAIARGYRVFIWPGYVTDQLTGDPRYRLEESRFGEGETRLVELYQVSGR